MFQDSSPSVLFFLGKQLKGEVLKKHSSLFIKKTELKKLGVKPRDAITAAVCRCWGEVVGLCEDGGS